MSAQSTSPGAGASKVAADQPKDRNEPLPEAQPRSQDVNQGHPITTQSQSSGERDSAAQEEEEESSSSSSSSSSSIVSPQSQESGEASPVRSVADQSSTPPLPNEAPPATEDDGWDFHWDPTSQAYFFYNRFTHETTWENPRFRNASAPGTSAPQPQAQAEAISSNAPEPPKNEQPPVGGYNPAIHGDYDPNAWYAQTNEEPAPGQDQTVDTSAAYAAMGTFNRFTGRWQGADQNPDRHNDEQKSKRQMNAFFDVDAAANSHDGRSLKAERSGKKPTKQELKQFKEKRRARKEEKRRAWLRD